MSIYPIGEVDTPKPLRARASHIELRGWCLIPGYAQAPIVRLVVGATSITAAHQMPRPDVAALLHGEPAAQNCGFLLAGRLPPGTHLARIDAHAPTGEWIAFKEFTIAVEASPLAGSVDTPIAQGTLRDRVKVGGWALHPDQQITRLTLRYGHREIDCVLGQPRADVPEAFPEHPQAPRAGFQSADFLVAGHGAVRIRAQLTDGSCAIRETSVAFSVASDENHSPELELTAAPVFLPSAASPSPRSPPPRTTQPKNILFLLPGSFASNNALHVAALANELAASGHRCAVAVAHDVATIAHHAAPAYVPLKHSDALSHRYPDGRGPDIVHAWTTRESVRRQAEELQQRHGSRLIVHLEDNEQEVLALSLHRKFAELDVLSDETLDALVPSDLSHPHRSRSFLASADGITLITPKLREFAPITVRHLTLWPAADERYFYPRPRPDDFRRVLDVTADTTVLFYHGNVHAANAAEMRELYAAVARLNETGTPVTLIRTGLDTVDFLGGHAARTREHVLELGQILHHRHLAPLMALADIFVQPGAPDDFNNYRFPSKLPEFFALGRPVVLPRANLGEKVRHGIDAYVLDRADAAGITQAVREIRAHPDLAERLSSGAVRFAAEHFSWRRSAEALAKFYAAVTPSS